MDDLIYAAQATILFVLIFGFVGGVVWINISEPRRRALLTPRERAAEDESYRKFNEDWAGIGSGPPDPRAEEWNRERRAAEAARKAARRSRVD